jgi:hypothetical protein
MYLFNYPTIFLFEELSIGLHCHDGSDGILYPEPKNSSMWRILINAIKDQQVEQIQLPFSFIFYL